MAGQSLAHWYVLLRHNYLYLSLLQSLSSVTVHQNFQSPPSLPHVRPYLFSSFNTPLLIYQHPSFFFILGVNFCHPDYIDFQHVVTHINEFVQRHRRANEVSQVLFVSWTRGECLYLPGIVDDMWMADLSHPALY